jgi:hypothetical protein
MKSVSIWLFKNFQLTLFCIFFLSKIEEVFFVCLFGHSFAYVAHLVYLTIFERWLDQTQRAAVASRRAANLASISLLTHPPPYPSYGNIIYRRYLLISLLVLKYLFSPCNACATSIGFKRQECFAFQYFLLAIIFFRFNIYRERKDRGKSSDHLHVQSQVQFVCYWS